MVAKALMVVQGTGLFETAILEWITFTLVDQSWPEFKEYFSKAYENHITSGAGTAGTNNYYGDANTFENNNDDSIQPMKESFGTTQLANNPNLQVINDNISAMTRNTQEL